MFLEPWLPMLANMDINIIVGVHITWILANYNINAIRHDNNQSMMTDGLRP